MQSRARIIAGLLVGGVLGIFGPTLIAVAHHSGSGSSSITGTVTSAETGDPIEAYCVSAWFSRDSQVLNDEIFAGSTQTLEDGTYTLGRLPLDAYKVEFHSCGSRRVGGVRVTTALISTHLPEFWNDVRTYDEATAIVVGPSQRVTGIDAAIDDIQ